jgi:hypothetical protein
LAFLFVASRIKVNKMKKLSLAVSLFFLLANRLSAQEPVFSLGSEHVISTSPPAFYAPFTWGPWQFPSISRLPGGIIIDRFSTGMDAASDYGKVANFLSADAGSTWKISNDSSLNHVGILLPNGDRLEAAVLASTPLSRLDLSRIKVAGQMASCGLVYKFFDSHDLPPQLSKYSFYRLKAGETTWQLEETWVKDNDVPRGVSEGVFSLSWLMNIKVAPDGSLLATHPGSFREVGPARRYGGISSRWRYCVVFFRSTDHGKNWSVYSEIPYQGDLKADSLADMRDGFSEPAFEFMPDGSMICIMRTCDGSGNGPMYIARSIDQGKTWNKPEVFAPFGVWPQLVMLKNGVVVLSYGRPGVHIMYSRDGIEWSKSIALLAGSGSCGYTGLQATGDHKFLITYSKWPLKNDKGENCKAIVVREVTIED